MRRTPGKMSAKQNLSSETLLHFTDSLEVVKLILNTGFQARYIYEKLPSNKLAYFVKTVCFCDIPLGAIKTHLNWYGDYGIGVASSWARKKKISPVVYINSQTPFINFSASASNRTNLEASATTRYLKQILGKQMFYNETKKEEYYKKKKFYEEREWRYFPDDFDLRVELYKKEPLLEAERVSLNQNKLPHLELDLGKVEYIIVRDRKEVQDVIREIQKLYKKKLLRNKVERDNLITKIMTTSQITKDF